MYSEIHLSTSIFGNSSSAQPQVILDPVYLSVSYDYDQSQLLKLLTSVWEISLGMMMLPLVEGSSYLVEILDNNCVSYF